MSVPVTDTYEYRQLTKVLEVLEQQREQVLKDKEIIQTAFQDALKSPIEYIESLIEGKIKLPKKINIVQIPNFAVGLPRYNNSGSSSHNNNNNNNHISSDSSGNSSKKRERISDTPVYRTLRIDSSSSRSKKILDPIVESDTENKNKGALSTLTSNTDIAESLSTTTSTTQTFEKKRSDSQIKSYWTEEEQEKLERLLVEYPEEEVATHRWTKIANELGNRTPSQIASRTQKFFKKLEKAGKKIPGSTPKKKSSSSFSSKNSSSAQSSSSDRSDTEPTLTPIKRRETTTTTTGTPSNSLKRSFSTMKSSSSTTTVATPTPPQTRTHTNASSTSSSKMIHEGYKCDGCDEEPIIGTRWHCEECIQDVDLCQNCKESYEEIGSHNSSHHIIPIENPDPYFLDEDYKFSYPSGESNYLDPNYR